MTPSFWAFFVDASRESEEERCARFASAIDFLVNAYTDIGVLVDRMDGLGVPCNAYGQTTYRGLFNLTLKGTLHSQLPGNFEVVVEVFYARYVLYIMWNSRCVSQSVQSKGAELNYVAQCFHFLCSGRSTFSACARKKTEPL